MGRLMVIDGLDGCGKSTQLGMLDDALRTRGVSYRQISFPDYEQESSALVRMYLAGQLGESAGDVNAYAASSFYAVDRYASYKQFWEADYRADIPIVAARYTTSNAIHQMSKLPEADWDAYLAWLKDYEYTRLGLPAPDKVIFLDMPPEVSRTLLAKRYQGDESKKDIHERDDSYLERCRQAALYAAAHEEWTVLPCSDNGKPLSPELIHRQILGLFDGM